MSLHPNGRLKYVNILDKKNKKKTDNEQDRGLYIIRNYLVLENLGHLPHIFLWVVQQGTLIATQIYLVTKFQLINSKER